MVENDGGYRGIFWANIVLKPGADDSDDHEFWSAVPKREDAWRRYIQRDRGA